MAETVPPAGMVNYLLTGCFKYAPAVAVVKMAAYHRVAVGISGILRGRFDEHPGPQRLVKQEQIANGAVNGLIAHRPIQKVWSHGLLPAVAVMANHINRYFIINRFGVYRGMGHAGRLENIIVHIIGITLARHLFDDRAEYHKVGVVI